MQEYSNLKNLIVATLDINKASDIVTINLEGKSSIADYMIIASGTSSRHIQSLSEQVLEEFKKSGINGIMRQVVIDNAKLFFKEVCEIEIKRKTISIFDDMFVTNSVIKILPVTHLSNKKFRTTNATREMINFFFKKSKRSKNLELV